jgi:hypothetical protein
MSSDKGGSRPTHQQASHELSIVAPCRMYKLLIQLNNQT